MKKLILTLLVAATGLFADYNILVSTTDQINESDVIKKEEIYFGEYNDYLSDFKQVMLKASEGTLTGLSGGAGALAQGLFTEGLKAGAAGAGIGLFYGGIQYMIDQSNAAQRYILLEKYTLKDGSYELKSYYFSGNKKPVYEKEEIKKYIGAKQ